MTTETAPRTPLNIAPDDLPAYVAAQRAAHARLKKAWDLAYEKWLQDNTELKADLVQATESVAQAETALREAAVDLWRASATPDGDGGLIGGNRHPLPGVEVKMFTEIAYEPVQALDWAKEHKMALALDKKAFEAVAKNDSTRPDFVKVSQEPRATIATDLDAALAKPEAPAKAV